MDSEEATKLFEELVRILTATQLSWVVEQVRQQIAAGKEITKTVSVASDAPSEVTRRKRQRVPFASTTEFSREEQLSILVNAIDQSVVGTADMEREILALSSKDPAITRVRFESEIPGVDSVGFDATDVTVRVNSARRLQALCNEIKREIAGAN